MDTKKGYNELVEKVLNRLEENDLFVKPEKYWWKVKKIEFLRYSNWTLRGRNAEGENKQSSKLTSTKKYKGSTKVSRACKLLQAVY